MASVMSLLLVTCLSHTLWNAFRAAADMCHGCNEMEMNNYMDHICAKRHQIHTTTELELHTCTCMSQHTIFCDTDCYMLLYRLVLL